MHAARCISSIIIFKDHVLIFTVFQIQTSLGPEALLEKLKSIEQAMGRKAGIRYGPRVIDLDILFYADLKYQTSILTIPHPQMHERDFVLGPLMDICPDHVRTSQFSVQSSLKPVLTV